MQLAGNDGAARKPFYKLLYVQVLIAIVLGFLVGWLAPDIAESPWMKALGDGFIKLIKMVIAPIIFCTVVSRHRAHPGCAQGRPRRRQGARLLRDRLDLRAGHRPVRRQLRCARATASAARGDAARGRRIRHARRAPDRPVEFILHIIPNTMVGAFAEGDILQVLLIAILFGFALMVLGERGHAGAHARSTISATPSSASSPSS